MTTFRYLFLVSDVSVNFGESESSLVDRDKSLVEGMLVTEKRKWHRCKMKLHDLFWSCNYNTLKLNLNAM